MNLAKTLYLFLVALCSQTLCGQDGLKVWLGHSYRTNVNKKWRLNAGQLYLFDDELSLSALQNSARVRYRFNKHWRVSLGYVRSSNPADPDQEARNRIDPQISHHFRTGKWRIFNSFRVEWHFPLRSKFEYRFRYTLGVSLRKLRLPLQLTPFVNNELHYYLDGKPFNYRDSSGDVVVRQSPDGLHAHRIRFGFRFRPFNRAVASLSYLKQTEFNIGDRFRRINVTDPRTGEVKRDFNNFDVLSFNFSYRFKI